MILITGATGFLGGSIVGKIAEKRKDIRILAIDYENAGRVYPEFDVVKGDITRKETLSGVGRDVDTVVHLAGLVSYSKKKRDNLMLINHEGTKNLLEECKNAGRFVFSSSVSVYGEIAPGEKADEDYQRNPINAYGLSKLMAEQEVLNSGIPFIIFRIAPVYGSGSPQWKTNLSMLEKGFPIPKTGNLTHITHISNLVQAFDLSLKSDQGVYNIADPAPLKFTELAGRLVSMLGKKPRTLPMWVVKALAFLKGKSGYMDILTMNRNYDISSAMKKMNYSPEENTDSWLREMVDWYSGKAE